MVSSFSNGAAYFYSIADREPSGKTVENEDAVKLLLSKDLTDPRWMYLKAALFAVIGVSSVALILAEHPSWKVASLLALAIWSFARLYYFAFYVIERYIDPTFKFAGLWSVVKYLLWRKPPKVTTWESFPDA